MSKIRYCERCGFMHWGPFRRKCTTCGIKLKIIPEEMKQKYNIFNDSWSELWTEYNTKAYTYDEMIKLKEEMIAREKAFVMNELASNPLFSMEEYEKQIQRQREKNHELAKFSEKEIREKSLKLMDKNLKRMGMSPIPRSGTPRCPICGSSNISKITMATRAVKTAAFGVVGAVDDAGRTYKCQNCGSKF